MSEDDAQLQFAMSALSSDVTRLGQNVQNLHEEIIAASEKIEDLAPVVTALVDAVTNLTDTLKERWEFWTPQAQAPEAEG